MTRETPSNGGDHASHEDGGGRIRPAPGGGGQDGGGGGGLDSLVQAGRAFITEEEEEEKPTQEILLGVPPAGAPREHEEEEEDPCGLRWEGATEGEVDASLREALLVAAAQVSGEDAKCKSAFHDDVSSNRRIDVGSDGEPIRDADCIQWKSTVHVGVFRDLWIEKRHDATHGKWRARVAKARAWAPVAEDEEVPAAEEEGEDVRAGASRTGETSADELFREVARMRRKVRSQQQQQQQQQADGAIGRDDVEIGSGPDEATEDRGEWAAGPGAFRMGGVGEGMDGEIDDDDDRDLTVDAVPPPTSATLAAQRSDAILLDADLVVEQDGSGAPLVKAEPIRRKRQAVAVMALVVLTAIVVGATTGVILSRPDPKPTPSYQFVNVSSMQAVFNKSLPNATVEEINRGSTPQADAYRWLFASDDGHPDLPESDALTRMLHRFALASLFYSTGGNDTWKISTGWLDPAEHECFWHGVSCSNGTSDAVAACKNAFGIQSVSCRIPNSTAIDGLDLSGNGLRRSLPGEIGLLRTSGISQIQLDNNDLAGAAPSEIGELWSLQVLSLRGNRLDGTMPSTIGGLNKLETLFLSQNDMSGSIPASLANLGNLRDIDLSQNNFEGELPTQIGLMTALRTIVAWTNLLSGTIPTELANLTNLQTLVLSDNDLTITFPSGKSMSSLQVLALSENTYGATLPSQIGDFTSLTRLDLFTNRLTGTIPSELGLVNLEYLRLHQTGLTGTIPTEVGNLRSLIVWNTGDSKLTGPLPSELARLTALEELLVDRCAHSGTIPAEIGDLSSLRELDANGNILSGPLPTELGMLEALEQLWAGGRFGTAYSRQRLMKMID
jgi:Leucine-rich repeat (LRR) protein